ncbi:hypothetical protein D1Z86_23570, partial [Escherichia coli]|nr:hypothetical protein [Escherichia coli]
QLSLLLLNTFNKQINNHQKYKLLILMNVINSRNKYIVWIMFLINRSIILHYTVYIYSIIFTCRVKRSFPSQSLTFLNKL